MGNGDLALANQDLAGLIQNKEEIFLLIISFSLGNIGMFVFRLSLHRWIQKFFIRGVQSFPKVKTGNYQFPLPAFHLREFN